MKLGGHGWMPEIPKRASIRFVKCWTSPKTISFERSGASSGMKRQSESLSRQLMALWVLVIMVIVGFGLLTWYQVLLQRRP